MLAISNISNASNASVVSCVSLRGINKVIFKESVLLFTRVDRSILRILRVLIAGTDKMSGANFYIQMKTNVSAN